MNEILWDLFKTTGDIKYFLLLQKIEVKDHGNKKTRRNSTK